jgi:hypothetical protein
MDTFNFDFDTDSTLTNDTNSNNSNLDWTAFQSAPPLPPQPITIINNPFSPTWSSQQDDAVAPDNRSNIMTTPHDDGIYFEIERFFNGLNEQEDLQSQQEQGIIEPIHVNIQIPDQINHIEPLVSAKNFHFAFHFYVLASSSFIINDYRTTIDLFTRTTCTTSFIITFTMLS